MDARRPSDEALTRLIEQNERQQRTITEQAETIGRLTTERDALQQRVRELEQPTTNGDPTIDDGLIPERTGPVKMLPLGIATLLVIVLIVWYVWW